MNETGRKKLERKNPDSNLSHQEINAFIRNYAERFNIPRSTEKQILKGNPAIGHVAHIRQMHRYGEGDIDTSAELSRTEKEIIAQYQAEILRHLMGSKYDVIYLEGILFDDARKVHAYEARIRQSFPQGIPHENEVLNDAQRNCLYTCGAGMVYGVLTGTPIKGPEQRYLMVGAQRSIEKHGGFHTKDTYAHLSLFFARERFAAKEVRKYLDAHPGARVALIYGSGHTFETNFERDLPIQGVWWKRFGRRTAMDRPEVDEVHFPAVSQAHTALASGTVPNLSNSLRAMYHRSRVKKSHTGDENLRARQREKKRRAGIERKTDRMVESAVRFDQFSKKIEKP